eukprot:gene6501-10509_t
MLRGRELLSITRKVNQILKFKQFINPKLFNQYKKYSTEILKKEKKQKKKFLTSNQKYALIMAGIILCSFISFSFIQNNQKYFNVYVSPTEVLENLEMYPPNRRFKLGGLVKIGSVRHNPNSFLTNFVLTDLANEIEVSYKGLLPDMFTEGTGGVCEGFMVGPNQMKAVLCLAKHDQRYLPLDLAQVVARNKKELVKRRGEELAENPEMQTYTPAFTGDRKK